MNQPGQGAIRYLKRYCRKVENFTGMVVFSPISFSHSVRIKVLGLTSPWLVKIPWVMEVGGTQRTGKPGVLGVVSKPSIIGGKPKASARVTI